MQATHRKNSSGLHGAVQETTQKSNLFQSVTARAGSSIVMKSPRFPLVDRASNPLSSRSNLRSMSSNSSHYSLHITPWTSIQSCSKSLANDQSQPVASNSESTTRNFCLILRDNPIGDIACMAIVESLNMHGLYDELEELDISGNAMNDQGAFSLASIIRRRS